MREKKKATRARIEPATFWLLELRPPTAPPFFTHIFRERQETQREKEAYKQRHKVTKSQIDRETEIHRHRNRDTERETKSQRD